MVETIKQVEISTKEFKVIGEKENTLFGFKKKFGQKIREETTVVLKLLLGGAIDLRSSDIHIEPQKNQAKLRFRIDGVLQDVITFSTFVYKNLLSRIKLISGIKLNITKRAQNGRFSVLLTDPEKPSLPIEIRVSTLPSEYGESIVLRILNPERLLFLADLGLRKDLLKIFLQEIKRPNGMIIITGPTGSGKTTTLYAVLNEVKKPELKIITIEDPIEYHLEGISQTQVSPAAGYDFASGLKEIMRQDPDVILVGEIRDLETAQTALQASLTGHLVLSTLHTNDAAGTIVRLQALGEKSVNIAPAINIAIAQRLVRKVCQKCSQLITVPKETLIKLQKELKNIPKNILPKLLSKKTKIKSPGPKGCKFCNFTGFKGRVGIFETFLVDDEMEKFILEKPAISELKKLAIKKGMITMKQDGLIKVLEGITSIGEIERVTGE